MHNIPVSNKQLKDVLTKIVGSKEVFVKPGTVVSVDETNMTCVITPLDGDADYVGVRICPSSNSTSYEVPNTGTIVFVNFLDLRNPFVVSCDSVKYFVVQTLDPDTNKITSLKESLVSFSKGVIDEINKMVFTTPSGMSGAGPLATNQQALTKLQKDFEDKINLLFKQ